MKYKTDKIYKTIGEVAKDLNLINPKTGKLSTHTIRFWEKQFKQIKPQILAGKRRYYDNNTIVILKKIKFLLKDKGLTINGVKKFLIDERAFNLAKKTHIKVRLVPESKPDSPFFYYVKKPAGGEKAKVKLKAKKYNPSTRKHEVFIEKKLPPHSK